MTTERLPCTCILAGRGRGTRLGSLAESTPKPLLPLLPGNPSWSTSSICWPDTVPAVSCSVSGSSGRRSRPHSAAATVRSRWTTATTVTNSPARSVQSVGPSPLLGASFLILYGDTYLRIDYSEFARRWEASGCAGAMAVLRNADRWERSNAIYSSCQSPPIRHVAPTADMAWIDYGLGGLTAKALETVPEDVDELGSLYGLLAEHGDALRLPGLPTLLRHRHSREPTKD